MKALLKISLAEFQAVRSALRCADEEVAVTFEEVAVTLVLPCRRTFSIAGIRVLWIYSKSVAASVVSDKLDKRAGIPHEA